MSEKIKGKGPLHQALPGGEDTAIPSRALDAEIAEKVMGEPKPTGNVPDGVLAGVTTSSSDGGNWIGTTTGYTAGDEPVWLPKPYSEDIAAAWEVVEKLKADHIEPLIEWDEEDQEWYVHLSRYNTETECSEPICNAHAPTAPHAICLAALKALEDKP